MEFCDTALDKENRPSNTTEKFVFSINFYSCFFFIPRPKLLQFYKSPFLPRFSLLDLLREFNYHHIFYFLKR